MTAMTRVLGPEDLEDLIVVVGGREERRVVVFTHEIVPRRYNVEIKAPVDVMVMDITDAEVVVMCLMHSPKPEPGLQRTVEMEPPFGNISVPACTQLGLQHDFLAFDIDGYTHKIATVGAGFQY